MQARISSPMSIPALLAGGVVALVVFCALLVFPARLAFADTGYCIDCNRTTTGTYSYDNYYGIACYPPTCTEDGMGCFVCSECGNVNRPTTVAALGHDHQYSENTATCTDDGQYVYICSRCGDTYTEWAAALGHDYYLTTVDATCTEQGANTYTCSRCGASYSNPIAALGHDYVETTTEPTCTEQGAHTHTCSRCGDSYSEPIAALGHDMKEAKLVPAICTDAGLKKLIAARKATALPAAAVAVATAQAAAAAIPDHFDLIRLSERTIFAKLGDDPFNEEFLDVVKSRPNLVLVLYDPEKGTTLSEQIGEAAPNAVLLDFSGEAGFDQLREMIQDLRADHEGVKFEAIAFDADEQLRAKLAEAKDDETLFAFAMADANKYVKMSQLVVPLYKDLMKEAGSLEDIGTIADLFGIPAVSAMLGIVAKAERVEKVVSTAKDAFEGEDLELSDGISVTSNIANLLGLDELGKVAALVGSVTDTRDLLESDEEGAVHATYKASTIAEDVHDAVKGLMK